MANVVRLLNGGQIQVRTGVLQGVGPAGPRGQIGLTGPEGPQGPTGDIGPQGAIIQVQARANVSSTQTVTPDTNTNVAVGTVAYDDMSVFTSSTNFTTLSAGDYLLSAWVEIAKGTNNGDGIRKLSWTSNTAGLLAVNSCLAVVDDSTWLTCNTAYRAAANEVLHVVVRSGDDVNVSVTAGAVTITRVGSGPVGEAGPQGATGLTGATGATGPQGPAGSANSGFATYADLL